MKKTKINVLFLPERDPSRKPLENQKRINDIFFPYMEDWNVFVLLREPALFKGYNQHIIPIKMYGAKEYAYKITKKQIEDAENWLGFPFNTLINMEDNYCNRKFSPTINKKRNITRHILFYKRIINENRIDLVSLCFPNNLVNILLYYVVKKMEIPHWNLVFPHRGFSLENDLPRYDLCSDSNFFDITSPKPNKQRVDYIYKKQQQKILNRKKVFCSEIGNETKEGLRNSLNTFQIKWVQLKNIIKNQSKFETNFNFFDLTTNYFKKSLNYRLNNSIFAKGLFEKEIPKKPFFFFPLHFITDSTMTFREPLKDQVQIIKKIAYSLPSNTRLAVKLHPHYLGSDYSFSNFKKLKRIPNLRLLSYNINTIELIKRSLGVLTINSTVGYETILLNKPLITFGHESYAQKDVSVLVRDLDDLPKILINIKNNPNYKISLYKRKRYVANYYLNSFELKNSLLDTEKGLTEQDKKVIIKKYREFAKKVLKK